ncbi:MAG: CatB-related O-acetyltransferase [Dehalococcoidales bacterium]|nr:CatB-related O-acetyltransferase [Dehalococcoidales bacterium]
MLQKRIRRLIPKVLMLIRGRGVIEIKDWELLEPELFSIGIGTYGHPLIHIWDKRTRLIIGKFCSISDGSEFVLGGNHLKSCITTYPLESYLNATPQSEYIEDYTSTKGDIIIGNDVWIGIRAIILSGVKVGDGVIIGAGSVVAASKRIMPAGIIPPYSIIAGNPANIIGHRFPQDIIDKLLEIKWWDWPSSLIKNNIQIIHNNDIDNLRKINKEKDINKRH